MTIETRELVYIDPQTNEERRTEVNYDTERDAVIVELDKPLEIGTTEKHTEIVINSPTWEQLEKIELSKGGITLKTIKDLATKLTGLDSLRLGRLKGKNIRGVIAGVTYFLQESLGK